MSLHSLELTKMINYIDQKGLPDSSAFLATQVTKQFLSLRLLHRFFVDTLSTTTGSEKLSISILPRSESSSSLVGVPSDPQRKTRLRREIMSVNKQSANTNQPLSECLKSRKNRFLLGHATLAKNTVT